jgi:hypothetical protein
VVIFNAIVALLKVVAGILPVVISYFAGSKIQEAKVIKKNAEIKDEQAGVRAPTRDELIDRMRNGEF